MNSLCIGRIAWYPFRRGSRVGFCGSFEEYDFEFLKRNELIPVTKGDCEYLICHYDSEQRAIPSVIDLKREIVTHSVRIASGGCYLVSIPVLWKDDICSALEDCGFFHQRVYYPFPNGHFPQLIYSDEHRPDETVEEKGSAPGRETDIRDIFIEACTQPFCNEDKVYFAAISSERISERAFVTYESSDGFFYKKAIYPEGMPNLDKLVEDSVRLEGKNVQVLVPEKCGKNLIRTPKQTYITLKQYISEIVKSGDRIKLIDVLDRLYDEISKARPIDDDVVYTEMIPINAFVRTDGNIIFFDQEYTRNDVGFDSPMFRSIRDVYFYNTDAGILVSQEELIERYGLKERWNEYLFKEDIFWNRVKRKGYYLMKENLDRETQPMNAGGVAIFDPLEGLFNKKIILFGTGKYADGFFEQYIENSNRDVAFFVDNSSEKIGKEKNGTEIKSPEEITNLEHGSYRVVIVVKDYEEIYSQLQRMGVYRTDIRIYSPAFHWEYDPYKIINAKTDGKYNIGFTTGVFDLFHIGHLNILKNAKSRCHYLIAGVLSDELAAQDKGRIPIIPYEERAEIIRSCGFVNQVVKIDFHNTDKMVCFKELHFGCLFAGGDHADDDYWLTLRDRLLSVGSNLEFFPYTKMTNSSVLRESLKDRESDKNSADNVDNKRKSKLSSDMVLMTKGLVDFIFPKEGVDFIGRSSFASICPCLGDIVAEKSSTIGDELRKNPSKLWHHSEWTIRELNIRQLSIPVVMGSSGKGIIDNEAELSFIKDIAIETIKICSHIGCEKLILPLPQTSGIGDERTVLSDYYEGLIDTAKEEHIRILITNCNSEDSELQLEHASFVDSETIKDFIDNLNDTAGEGVFGLAVDIESIEVIGKDVIKYVQSVSDRMDAIILHCSPVNRIDLANVLSKEGYDGMLIFDISKDIDSNPYILRQNVIDLNANRVNYLEWALKLDKRIKDEAEGRDIVIFGTGRMARSFISIYGKEYKPVFACDNSSDKWGEKVLDIEIKAPSELKAMDPEKTCAIICNRHYDEVTLQLRSLGINHIEWYNDEFFSERTLS